jgi:Sulphur transport
MTVAITSLTFLVATLCAALMGYAIQRGATCTVAAVGEIVEKRSFNRLAAMGEAALWVAGGMMVAGQFGLIAELPKGFALSGWTIMGGMLLGLGASVNRACVFGSIAKFGSGNWAYALTPPGFFIGTAALSHLFPRIESSPLISAPSLPGAAIAAVGLLLIWRMSGLVRGTYSGQNVVPHAWTPHLATTIIGITFLIMFISVGAWTYTDLLMRLARGMSTELDWRLILFGALLGGAVVGGWTAGRLSFQKPSLSTLARCFVGGLLMGTGSTLIPGGNDGLILVGIPLFMPYAWVAIASMCAAIWVALKFERSIKQD